jgi:hypothetical protein
VAASVVLTASLVAATLAYVNSRNTRDQLAEVDRGLKRIQVTAGEIASYQRVWREIVSPNDKRKPWILLNDSGGRFEYLPADDRHAGNGRFTVLRCLMVSTDGAVREEVNLLLPGNRPVKASLGETGRIAGLPVHCDVVANGQRVGVNVTVGDGERGAVGVQGNVRLGDRASEIGEFKLDGRKLKVFLQGLPVASDHVG